jgi:arylsulfatase A-like enzyme
MSSRPGVRVPVIVFALCLLPLCLTSTAARAGAPQRPNVVFILVDDLRWDALGCTGHPFSKTPNLDRLAKEGALFKNAFVTTPLCSPARGSFLTGKYVHSHGVKGNADNAALSHQLATFPRLLHDRGYETAYVGKWHMGNDDTPRPGFDRWVSFKGQGQHVDPMINIDGQAMKATGYMADILTDHSVEWVKKPHAKPFCLYLAHKAVHGPFVPAPRHKDLFADQPIKRAPNAQDTNEGKPALTRKIGNMPTPGPGTGSGDELIRNQLRMLVAIDEGVGKLLQALEETKQLANTLVVFTSDNGYFWGEHGLGDKRWAYEESIRIPLLMRWPRRIKAGTTMEQMVLNVDIAPTVLDAAGVNVPKEMQGRSILPLFGGGKEWRKSALLEYFMEPRFPRTPTWQAVRTDRWKYIRYPELEGMDELYDLKADPHEMKNRIQDPSAQDALKEMKTELDRLVKQPS